MSEGSDSGRDLIVFRSSCGCGMSVSLTEIEEAVKDLNHEELAKRAAFIARQDKLVWDKELEQTFRLAENTPARWKRSTPRLTLKTLGRCREIPCA